MFLIMSHTTEPVKTLWQLSPDMCEYILRLWLWYCPIWWKLSKLQKLLYIHKKSGIRAH